MGAKRVLVTGASGFVGANLARRLLLEGHNLHLIQRHDYTSWRLHDVLLETTLHLADLESGADVLALVDRVRPDWIVHLAVEGAYASQNDLQKIVGTNINGTVNLLAAASLVGCEVFINTGSSSEYGRKDHAPTEDEALQPNSVYAATKAACTLLCEQVARNRGLPVYTLRLYSVYGPYEDPGRLIPSLLRNGFLGCFPPLADPSIARDFVHVDDVCAAYLAAANASSQIDGNRIFNIGTGIQTQLQQIVSVAAELMGVASKPDWGKFASRTWDTDVWIADPSKARDLLGWRPATDVRAGLARTIEWYRDRRGLLDLEKSVSTDP
jgi:nucleoside-diphosphate-sugar epimerase